MAKKRSRGRKLPKKGKEGNVKDHPHLPTLDLLVKNILENPGTAGKSADQLSAENQEQAAAAETQREKAVSKRAETNMRLRIVEFWEQRARVLAQEAKAKTARQREEQKAQLAEREAHHRRQVAAAVREAAVAAWQHQEQRQHIQVVAKAVAVDGAQRQRRQAQHLRVANAAADAARLQIEEQTQIKEETVEKMVQQMESALDNEFAHFLPVRAPKVAQSYSVSDKRVPAATVTELENVTRENK